MTLLKLSFPFSKIEPSLYWEVESSEIRSTEMANCCGVTELMITHSEVPDFLTDNSYPITDEESLGALQVKLISCSAAVEAKFLGAYELIVGLVDFSAEELFEGSGFATASSVGVSVGSTTSSVGLSLVSPEVSSVAATSLVF